ncbi:MAG: AraC family transcriptional regulator [Tissierellia bacterium]|nr:AraC family transcriptional regulator [Tissierellia bacterium]
MTITEYTQRKRISMAEHLILSTDLTIGNIAKSVGYQSHSRFSKLFKRYKGFSPIEFKKMLDK